MRANRSMPQSRVIPVPAYPDVKKALDWLCATFGFTVRWQAGNHLAQLNVGDEGAIAVMQQEAPVSVRMVETNLATPSWFASRTWMATSNGPGSEARTS